MQNGDPAVLGMPDKDKPGLISFYCETTHRQMVTDDLTDNSKRNGQCKRAIQIEDRKCEQFESEKQDVEAQSQQDADNTAKPTIVTNPTVIGNNKNDFFAQTVNDGYNFLSEIIINENQSFVSDQLREDNTVAADAKQTSKIHTNDNESFVSDQCNVPHLEPQAIQKKKKRKQEKK